MEPGDVSTVLSAVNVKRKSRTAIEKYICVFSSCSRSQLRGQMQGEVLSILSSMADLSNAIHWMPPGFLWAGRFPNWLVGLMGTISSLIGLIQMSAGDSDQTNSA